ncbi:hypothetical protein N7452_009218 [Penicillium brevicompactum]|uniref:Fatty acyl-CoA reductase n=1 Tax=Penicillium brevicompactum TaxID=5074 RepID=A0A9W9QAS7_PENBR|nr:hypothetical protein N7452_009218 [Penicillium brevicompactum]
MWNYYNDKTVFITGGTGFLGTALAYRLLTQTSVRHIYLLCRGDLQKVRSNWTESLEPTIVEKLLSLNRVTAMNGDILLPNLGLSSENLSTIQEQVNVVIHSASSINLAKPLSGLRNIIVGASETIADVALTCTHLDRFVYVSTAYANSHLPASGRSIDVEIEEKIYDPNLHPNLSKEWTDVQQFGSSDAFVNHDFPWSYAYAKNLTERLLLDRFTQTGAGAKLLILRPSIIGPAQVFPFPGYNVPLSCPPTMLAAALALSPKWTATIGTKATESSQLTTDEVPVDVVVDRLLAHLAMGTEGCVHAVSGKRARIPSLEWWQLAAEHRRLPWKCRLDLKDLNWKSPEQHPMARLFVILGSSFCFFEDKTINLSQDPIVAECEGLQLFTKLNLGQKLLGRTEDIRFAMTHFAKRNIGARVMIKLFYQDGDGYACLYHMISLIIIMLVCFLIFMLAPAASKALLASSFLSYN